MTQAELAELDRLIDAADAAGALQLMAAYDGPEDGEAYFDVLSDRSRSETRGRRRAGRARAVG